MTSMSPEDKHLLNAKVRRAVGMSALRRLRVLVDEWQEDDRTKATIARRASYAIGVSVILLTVLFLISPEAMMTALRSVTALTR